jgi:hypothetical protein
MMEMIGANQDNGFRRSLGAQRVKEPHHQATGQKMMSHNTRSNPLAR